jgi:hypothetical protein
MSMIVRPVKAACGIQPFKPQWYFTLGGNNCNMGSNETTAASTLPASSVYYANSFCRDGGTCCPQGYSTSCSSGGSNCNVCRWGTCPGCVMQTITCTCNMPDFQNASISVATADAYSSTTLVVQIVPSAAKASTRIKGISIVGLFFSSFGFGANTTFTNIDVISTIATSYNSKTSVLQLQFSSPVLAVAPFSPVKCTIVGLQNVASGLTTRLARVSTYSSTSRAANTAPQISEPALQIMFPCVNDVHGDIVVPGPATFTGSCRQTNVYIKFILFSSQKSTLHVLIMLAAAVAASTTAPCCVYVSTESIAATAEMSFYGKLTSNLGYDESLSIESSFAIVAFVICMRYICFSVPRFRTPSVCWPRMNVSIAHLMLLLAAQAASFLPAAHGVSSATIQLSQVAQVAGSRATIYFETLASIPVDGEITLQFPFGRYGNGTMAALGTMWGSQIDGPGNQGHGSGQMSLQAVNLLSDGVSVIYMIGAPEWCVKMTVPTLNPCQQRAIVSTNSISDFNYSNWDAYSPWNGDCASATYKVKNQPSPLKDYLPFIGSTGRCDVSIPQPSSPSTSFVRDGRVIITTKTALPSGSITVTCSGLTIFTMASRNGGLRISTSADSNVSSVDVFEAQWQCGERDITGHQYSAFVPPDMVYFFFSWASGAWSRCRLLCHHHFFQFNFDKLF